MDRETGPSMRPEDAVRAIQRWWRRYLVWKELWMVCTCGVGTAIRNGLVRNGFEFQENGDLVTSNCEDGPEACAYLGLGECGIDHCHFLGTLGSCNPRAAVHDFRTGKTFDFSGKILWG